MNLRHGRRTNNYKVMGTQLKRKEFERLVEVEFNVPAGV